MSNAAEDIETKEEVIWGTWEELLLAFAVKRHGLKDWDTVAMELQNRQHHRGSSFPPGLFTAQICKDKYRNLKRRFTNHCHGSGGGGGGGGGSGENNNESKFQSDDDDENDEVVGGGVCAGDGGDDAFPWLEELRKRRVAELKQEVHRYDVSIRSLQVKVKTMEEERENNLKAERNDDVEQQQPDLDNEEVKRERSENGKSNDGDKEMPPEQVAGKSVSGSAGEDENMSFNESNSAGNRGASVKTEPAEVKPDPHMKPVGVGREDSCNDSSDRHEVKKKNNLSEEREKDDGGGDSGEFRDSVCESKEGTKESSDVQSSASLLTSKRKRRRVEGEGVDGGGGGGDGSTAPIKRESEEGDGGAVKSSEPSAVFLLLDKIRSHKHGSVFERRLQSQKTEKYKNTIRRHVDLEIIQARIDDGSYSSCSSKFYVDLLLLFNNAIVFFPKASPESMAAQELRELVMKELKDSSHQPLPIKLQPKPEPERSDSLLAKHKSTAPIVVCRKRSSISGKASSSSANKKVEKEKDDDKPVTNSKPLIRSPLSTSNEEEDSVKLKIKEKPVTGVRSMRRSNKGRTIINKTESTPSSSNNKSLGSQQHGVKDVGEAGKGDKKKSETAASTKKGSAADFLKRMKKNSPAKGTLLVEALKSSKDNAKGGKKEQQKKKVDERKDGLVRRSAAGGGGSRKTAEEDSSPSKRTLGRPSRKGKEVVASGRKRGRDGGEGEGSSQRAKKRSR